ncbi:MAG TPA: hypothetical protein VFG21_05185 [Xanthomonadaceae bacterium]|nr:hypothetical protein [Xanthomonadaceae bacterium]
MSTPAKTPLEHVTDTLTQLKEMRHHSTHSVETLTAHWLLFEGELKELEQADRIEALMMRQSELHAALEKQITALEELALQLQPPPEEAEGDEKKKKQSSSQH